MYNAKVFDIMEMPDQMKQKQKELYCFNQLQFLGENFLSSIFFSMIDYFIAMNESKFLTQIISFRYSSPICQKINDILQRSCQMSQNSKMQYFQQELRKIDPLNTKCGLMLEELLKQRQTGQYDWRHQSNQKKVLQTISQFFYISVNVIGQYNIGQGQSKIVLLPFDRGYYLVKFIAKKSCIFCKVENEKLFTNYACQHNICFNCLQKKFIYPTIYYADCFQFTCKKINRQEIENYFSANLTNNQMQTSQSQPQQTQLQKNQMGQSNTTNQMAQSNTTNQMTQSNTTNQMIQSNTKNQIIYSNTTNQMAQSNTTNFNKNNDLMEIEVKPEIKKCGLCKKESSIELFTNSRCQHQICFLCMQQGKTYCPIYNCRQYIDTIKFDAYMEKFKKLECDRCNQKIINDQQYFTNICAHRFCTKCLKAWIFNSFRSRLCPAFRCNQYISKNLLDEYLKQEKVQYECSKCKDLWVWDNLYSHSECEHLICFNCAQKMISRNVYGCPEINCRKNLLCSEFEKYFYEYQLKLVDEQEKLIKQVKVEEERQIQELQKQEELKKVEEEKQFQQGLENSYAFEQTQKKSRFISNPQQQQLPQPQQLQQEQQSQIIISQVNLNQFKEKSSTNSLHNNQPNSSFLQSRIFEKNEKLKELEIGECTLCFSPFSQYNLRQEIECKTHKIGVCCFLKVQKCPQCDTKQFSSQIYKPKPKLIIETIGQQDESLSSSKQFNSPQLNYNDDSRINPRMTQTQSQIKQPPRNSTMDNNLFRSQIGYGQSNVKQTYPAGYYGKR